MANWEPSHKRKMVHGHKQWNNKVGLEGRDNDRWFGWLVLFRNVNDRLLFKQGLWGSFSTVSVCHMYAHATNFF